MSEQTPLSIHEPDGPPKGGIVVIQEAFGVNDHIEDVAGRFAAEGWLAVAPHLFHRTGDPKLGYGDLSVVMPHMQALTADGVLADIDAALDHLVRANIPPERTGVVGFCMGGTITLVTAARRAGSNRRGRTWHGHVTSRSRRWPWRPRPCWPAAAARRPTT